MIRTVNGINGINGILPLGSYHRHSSRQRPSYLMLFIMYKHASYWRKRIGI